MIAWFVARPGLGPVLFVLMPRHGVHASDLLLLTIALLSWMLLVQRARRLMRHPRRGG